jgi:hypothetical protein
LIDDHDLAGRPLMEDHHLAAPPTMPHSRGDAGIGGNGEIMRKRRIVE